MKLNLIIVIYGPVFSMYIIDKILIFRLQVISYNLNLDDNNGIRIIWRDPGLITKIDLKFKTGRQVNDFKEYYSFKLVELNIYNSNCTFWELWTFWVQTW